MMRVALALSTLVGLCLTAASQAFDSSSNAPLKVYAGAINGLHNLDHSGRYDKILLKLQSLSDVPFELIVQPISRAIRNFENCPNCCASPTTNDPEFYIYENTIASNPLGVAKLYAFTRPDTSAISSIEQLEGLTVGAKLGAHLGRTVTQQVEFSLRAPGLSNGFQLLIQGRLDAFLAYTPDAYTTFDQLEMEPLPHSPAHPLAIHRDSVICKGEQGAQFILELNKLLQDEYHDGTQGAGES